MPQPDTFRAGSSGDVIVDLPGSPTPTAISIGDLLATEFPPREHILEPIIPTQGLVMAYGPRGTGKTHFSLGVAYAVASGSAFLGWSAPKPRGVLFLDGEMPATVIQERLASIVSANDKQPDAPLLIVNPDLQELGTPNLSDPMHQAALEGLLEDIELIIVDNLSTLCRGGVENEAESWLPVQEWALRQRSAGRSVLFIHHAGKNGGQRGTSRREDVLDTVIALKRPSDYQPEQGACFEVHFEKARGFHGTDAEPFEARLATDEHGRQTWILRSLDDSTFDKIIALHKEGLSQYEIANEVHRHKSRISRYLKKAREEGLIND